ncbi:MAG: AAA family ATPase [Pirellulaceae bacterium]
MNPELLQSPHRPFRATPNAKFYFAHHNIETARQTVVRAMLRAEGPAIVLGGAGLGKSLLAEMIALDLCERMDVVQLHAARLSSRRGLLQSILFELQLPYRDMSEGELRLSILDRLEPSPETAPDGVLLLVDEAHTLPAKLLDELRLINNFTRNGQPRTRLALIGNMRLEDTFTEPLMESFNQRLAARCYLQPMNRHDTYDFVRFQLAKAGLEPSQVITTDGLDTVYAASEGVPRLVNQLMDHALVLACTNNQSPISAPLIEEAWADLQQLPAPWNSVGGAASESSAIEFGSLDDCDDDSTSIYIHESDSVDPGDPHESEADIDESVEVDDVSGTTTSDATNDRVASKNFFAAFAPLDDQEIQHDIQAVAGQTDAAWDGGDTDYDIECCDEFDASFAIQSVAPQASLADASQPNRLQIALDEYVQVATPASTDYPAMIPDQFFANKPTDERLLALEDEQSQLDAMGVWENDPPLVAISNLSNVSRPGEVGSMQGKESGSAAESSQTPIVEPAAMTHLRCVEPQDLFGNDFDEELNIGETMPPALLTGRESQMAVTHATDDLADRRRAAQAADYVAQIQQHADEIAAASPSHVTVDQVLSTVHARQSTAEASQTTSARTTEATDDMDGTTGWQVSTAEDLGREAAIAQDIEDIVSQLNFSAFTVEPFSVEQISLDAPVRPVPEDSIRNGDNEEIYMLHRAQVHENQELFTEGSLDYDDDRDLLVVEEDLPVSAKLAEGMQEAKPVMRTAPYSQLFAKLRK